MIWIELVVKWVSKMNSSEFLDYNNPSSGNSFNMISER